MNDWRLVDGRFALEEEDQDFPQTVICSESQLRRELQRQLPLRPGMIALISPDGDGVNMGLGGPYAGIVWHPSPEEAKTVSYRVGVAGRITSPGMVEFVSEGIGAPFDPEDLFPVDEVIEAAVFFYQHHRLPEWIGWRSWNKKTSHWEFQPAQTPIPQKVAS